LIVGVRTEFDASRSEEGRGRRRGDRKGKGYECVDWEGGGFGLRLMGKLGGGGGPAEIGEDG